MSAASTIEPWRTPPRWRRVRRLHRSDIPQKYLLWLLDPSSLTERIVNLCPGRFRVRVLGQEYARPLRDEARALHMRQGARAVVRQVQLLCDETPWVYARTVIPLATLNRRLRRLRRLGSRSLGALLFSEPSLKRGAVEVRCVLPGDQLYRSVVQDLSRQPEAIWGRRSVFRLGGTSLLVCEFFLPGIGEFAE